MVLSAVVLDIFDMDSQFTIIPFKQRDRIVNDLQRLSEGLDSTQQLKVESIIWTLELWTQWDDDIRRIVGEAEEERRQASPQVSDISVASV